jgi:hypothetical protein
VFQEVHFFACLLYVYVVLLHVIWFLHLWFVSCRRVISNWLSFGYSCFSNYFIFYYFFGVECGCCYVILQHFATCKWCWWWWWSHFLLACQGHDIVIYFIGLKLALEWRNTSLGNLSWCVCLFQCKEQIEFMNGLDTFH